MSRTNHHRNQKNCKNGRDYGSRYKCNKDYGCGYGVDGRNLADNERRNDSKKIIDQEIKEYEENREG